MIQCKPDISRSCISRNWIYRGRMLDPIFCPPILRILQTWAQERDIFREIAVTPCIQFVGDNFSRNLLTAIAFVPVRWRQFFAKSTRAYLMLPVNAGWNTCCAMGSHTRRSIDTSIVSQSRVQLIQCQCKSRLQTANLGINNAFNQIVAVWPRCLHPPSCPSLRQFRSKSSVHDGL